MKRRTYYDYYELKAILSRTHRRAKHLVTCDDDSFMLVELKRGAGMAYIYCPGDEVTTMEVGRHDCTFAPWHNEHAVTVSAEEYDMFKLLVSLADHKAVHKKISDLIDEYAP